METKIFDKEECHICGKRCSSKSLKSHLRSHNNLVLYDCHLCDQRFQSKSYFNKHVRNHQASFPCKTCGKKYLSEHKLKSHTCNVEKPRNFKCDQCSKAFHSQHNLTCHIRTHTKEKPFSCDECDKNFSLKRSRDKHKKLKHDPNNTNLHICQYCYKIFSEVCDLKSHRKMHIRQHVCDYCNKAFINLSDLRRHTRIHTKEKPFKCDYCDKSFTQSSHVSSHVKYRHLKDIKMKKTKSKMYVCEICCMSVYNLSKHKRKHTGEKPHICTLCQKGFITGYDLRRHMQIHSDAGQTYACHKCGKGFKLEPYLLQHEKTHEKRDFPCSECDKSFTTVYSYQKHLDRIHRQIKPHECAICGKRYYDLSSLKKHYLHHTKLRLKEKLDSENLNDDLSSQELIEDFNYNKTDSVVQKCVSSDLSKEEISYLCHVCKISFSSLAFLEKHHIEFMKDKSKCCICNEKFNTMNKLLEHHRSHEESSLSS